MATLHLKRVSKFGALYALYLSIIWAFDYVYYPWLTLKFRYFVFLPLFASIFLVSGGGYYLYKYFQEDVFFTERINNWLQRPAKGTFLGRIKALVVDNPSWTFAAISIWWSPLHAYVFFRRDEDFRLSSFTKSIAKGSLFCAFFWGVVAGSILLLWSLIKLILR